MVECRRVVHISEAIAHSRELFLGYGLPIDQINTSPIIQHYIDCYVYGAEYEDNCIDPLVTLCQNLYIPTYYCVYIKGVIRRLTERLIDSILEEEITADFTYTIEWHSPTLGIIENFKSFHFEKYNNIRKNILQTVPHTDDYSNSSYYSPYGSNNLVIKGSKNA